MNKLRNLLMGCFLAFSLSSFASAEGLVFESNILEVEAGWEDATVAGAFSFRNGEDRGTHLLLRML